MPDTPTDISFHFTLPYGMSNHAVNMAIWKGTSVLGVWPIGREDALRMREELIALLIAREKE